MRQMTLKQKVGQLFVIEVAGRDAFRVSDAAKAVNQRLYGVDTPAQAIVKYQPGGVIYFTTRNNDDNIGNPAQVATLSNGLQFAALAPPRGIRCRSRSTRRVARSWPASARPRRRCPATWRSAPDARWQTPGARRRSSAPIAAVGVTQDYAPVSDVNVNPNNPVIGIRSIGSDPTLVSYLVDAQVRGYHAGGVSAVAKHFPGHGDTGVDSHFGLPEVTHTRAQMDVSTCRRSARRSPPASTRS